MPVPSSLSSCSHPSIFHYDEHSDWGILAVVIVVVIIVIIIVIIVHLIVVSGGWAK